MATLPERLYSAAQVRELEAIAVAHGVTEATLMQRAGRAAWQILQRRWPAARRILILAGGGNNAGDGYVLAHCAREAGYQVTVLTLADVSRLAGAAADARDRYLNESGVEQRFDGNLPDTADVVVDALLGTGLDRALAEPMRDTVECLRHTGCPVLSLDIPTGLHTDTGAIMGAAVHADVTITFVALKPGLLTGAGPRCCGEVLFDDLEIPAEWYASVPSRARRLSPRDSHLPKRARDAHKGASGHVLVIGGDHGMGGAVRLTAEAALRTGAGLVSVATRAAHVTAMLTGLPEATTHAVESGAELDALLQRATVAAIGPGLGRDAWGKALFEKVLASRLPLVVDADALNLLADSVRRRENWVLTPHPGEAARLLGKDTEHIQADRFHALDRLLERYAGTVVLKGAGSLVGTTGEVTALCDRGNPGMAAPGMGDALTGVIVALIAQGLAPSQAARAGVYLHALAGDRAALRGERGMLARDLIDELRGLVNP
ncbi:MAG TPA: NAD(P)H-hydrate dehydratase [Gammaproteobacteria bacterium]|nr:NAD(P)H-hydrate dehydratase [Gammaproteobacteria bacterium]